MVGLPCLLSQCAKLHVAGFTWAVFTRVYLELCTWPVAIITMDEWKEQRVRIKFSANLGKSATKTITRIQQAFRDQILSRTQAFQGHARFKTGRTSVDGDEHTGRSTNFTTPETVARIQELLRQNRRRTIYDIAEEVGIGYRTWQQFLTKELGMHHVAAKFVPRILTADQKQQCVDAVSGARRNGCHPIHRTPLIWHPVTSSYFQKWNWSWKDPGLITLRRFKPIRREC
jgi:hypothetical protein